MTHEHEMRCNPRVMADCYTTLNEILDAAIEPLDFATTHLRSTTSYYGVNSARA